MAGPPPRHDVVIRLTGQIIQRGGRGLGQYAFNLGAAGPQQAFANGGAQIRRHCIQGKEHSPGAHPSAPPKRSVHSAT
ncbi:hypothetical protein BDI01nite_32330 [Brevundimonas diminuta]|nr:hypothetical protein BDI01nite_32330 [Brevundimonas diminuta]